MKIRYTTSLQMNLCGFPALCIRAILMFLRANYSYFHKLQPADCLMENESVYCEVETEFLHTEEHRNLE
jgi:hypothetical protein